MKSGRFISRAVLRIVVVLVVLHAAIFGLAVTNSVYYDSGGIMGLLWWLGALWVLPIVALAALATDVLRNWLRLRNNREGQE